MFRELTRKHLELSKEEAIEILKTQKRGVLSLNGENGYPYGVPMNHFYNEEDGKIYFHGGKEGYKIDLIRKNNKASFCVINEGYKNEGEWFLNFKSVIVFGEIEIVEDFDKVVDISRKLSYKFTTDSDYIEKEISSFAEKTLCFSLSVEHITGKKVKES